MDCPVSLASTGQVASFSFAEMSIQSLDASLGFSDLPFHHAASIVSVSVFTLPPMRLSGKLGERLAPHCVTLDRLAPTREPAFSAVSSPVATMTATYASLRSRVSSDRAWCAESAREMNSRKTCGAYLSTICLPEPLRLISKSCVKSSVHHIWIALARCG